MRFGVVCVEEGGGGVQQCWAVIAVLVRYPWSGCPATGAAGGFGSSRKRSPLDDFDEEPEGNG